MSKIKSGTPAEVVSLYVSLSNADKDEVLRLIGRQSTAKAPCLILEGLSLRERERFAEMWGEELVKRLYPLVLHRALELVKERPNAETEELFAELDSRAKNTIEENTAEIVQLELAKQKEKRDRGSRPQTVRRNVEICDLRRADRELWSLNRLAGQYKVSVRAISKVLEDEQHWRLLAQTGTN